MSVLFPSFSKKTQKKSAGSSVLNAAIRSDKPHTQEAAHRFIEGTPPVRRIANVMMHIPEGRSGSRHFAKSVQNSALHSRGPQYRMNDVGGGGPSRPEHAHAHEVMRKYNKPIHNGITAHKIVYGGQQSAADN